MFNYPLYLNISHYSCLVVGAGAVGRRKALTLLKAGAKKVTMLDPKEFAEEEKLRSYPNFYRLLKKFSAEDLEGYFIVFAATSSLEANNYIARLAFEKGLLCNVATKGAEGSFIVPASFESHGLNVAISSNGASPALTKAMKDEIKEVIAVKYAKSLDFSQKIRKYIVDMDLSPVQKKEVLEIVLQKDFAVFFEKTPTVQKITDYFLQHLSGYFLKHLSGPLQPSVDEISEYCYFAFTQK